MSEGCWTKANDVDAALVALQVEYRTWDHLNYELVPLRIARKSRDIVDITDNFLDIKTWPAEAREDSTWQIDDLESEKQRRAHKVIEDSDAKAARKMAHAESVLGVDNDSRKDHGDGRKNDRGSPNDGDDHSNDNDAPLDDSDTPSDDGCGAANDTTPVSTKSDEPHFSQPLPSRTGTQAPDGALRPKRVHPFAHLVEMKKTADPLREPSFEIEDAHWEYVDWLSSIDANSSAKKDAGDDTNLTQSFADRVGSLRQDTWRSCCHFFRHDPDLVSAAWRFSVPGFGPEHTLKPYQLLGAAWIIRRIAM